jgi:hypothetical protein
MPEKTGMSTPAVAGLSVVVIVAGTVLGLYARAYHLISFPDVHIMQVTGDPPVTVSDGSLHVHSKAGWKPDSAIAGQTILPVGTQLDRNKCDLTVKTKSVSAFFWHDGTADDISPAQNTELKITIVHDPANSTSSGGSVTVKIPWNGALTIEDPDTGANGGFDSGNEDRKHRRPGRVESVKIEGANSSPTQPIVWTPVDKTVPHYTIGFCYK